ncbi:MAG: DoxX family protein [Chloroflexi bacterium]|nr:DoxX family protein [Chloroflexota bacterium]
MGILSTGEMQRVTGEFQQAQAAATLREKLERFDEAVVQLLARHSITLLRVSIGIVYIWFGALKFVPGLSPIEGFIREALPFLPGDLFLPFLAAWEVLIGVLFISGRFTRITILLMLAQMGGAMSPLLLATDKVFNHFPYGWNLVGQYIFKDIILVSAALVVAEGRGMPRPYLSSVPSSRLSTDNIAANTPPANFLPTPLQRLFLPVSNSLRLK